MSRQGGGDAERGGEKAADGPESEGGSSVGPEDDDYSSVEAGEPMLNYSRIEKALQDALGGREPSAVAAHRGLTVLGTRDGFVIRHRLGAPKAAVTRPHGNRVTALSLDESGTALGSCSDDGLVSVACPLDSQPTTYALGKPLRALAIDPLFTSRREKAVVSGGLAAKVVLNKRGWLTSQGTTLHAKEGVIHAIAWKGPYMAWANGVGVKVMDLQRNARVSFVQKPQGCPGPDTCTCHLAWQDEETLIIGWADCIKVLALRKTDEAGLQQGMPPVFGELVSSFSTDFLVCGVAPFNDELLVALAYMPAVPEDDADAAFTRAAESAAASRTGASAVPPPPVLADQPEIRVLHRLTGEEIYADILPVREWEHHLATQYALAWVPATPAAVAEARAQPSAALAGDEGADRRPYLVDRYVIMTPGDVLEARPRSVSDSVEWAVKTGKFEDAMMLVEQNQGSVTEEVCRALANEYLEALFESGEHALAASLCPKLLGRRADLWVRWVPRFREADRLSEVVPHIPLASPRLPVGVYDGALRHLMRSDPPLFLATLRKWPLPKAREPGARPHSVSFANDARDAAGAPAAGARGEGGDAPAAEAMATRGDHEALISIPALLADLKQAVATKASDELRDALAELLVLEGRVEEALDCYLTHPRGDAGTAKRHAGRVFDLIARHGLAGSVRDHAVALMELDASRACEVMLSDVDLFPIARTAAQLERRPRLLRLYLHALLVMRRAEYNVPQYKQLHTEQVRLYAEHDPRALGWLLRASDQYEIQDAYDVCCEHEQRLVPERVFLLRRMGNPKEALHILVEEEGSAAGAIRFIEEADREDLWAELVDHAMAHPEFLGDLLESLGETTLDAKEVVEKIPEGTHIPHLKRRLIRLFRGQKQQLMLQESCNAVVRSDVRALVLKVLRERRRGVLARVTAEVQETMRAARQQRRRQPAAARRAQGRQQRRRRRFVAVSLASGKVLTEDEFRVQQGKGSVQERGGGAAGAATADGARRRQDK